MAIKTILNFSPNFDSKKRKSKQIKFIIFHYTGMKKESEAINKLTDIQSEVSCHYLVIFNTKSRFTLLLYALYNEILMKNIIIISLISILLSFNVSAGTDGEDNLSKKTKPINVVVKTDGEKNFSKKTKPVKDCFEGVNRATFALNKGFDKVIFKPISKAYRVLPTTLRTGTGNVLNNLSSLVTIPNNVLQGEFTKAGINTGRFAINTTIGILGIFDVAKKMNFPEYEKEDYGQTFGTWGIGAGCYLVLPVLGPSTVRDTAGSFVNILGGDPYYNASTHGNNEFLTKSQFATTKILAGIDFRAKNLDTIDNLEKNSLDFYASVRSLYLQDRQRKIANRNATIEVLFEGDWEEIESK